MATKAIKASLKEAREAIKNKDFQLCLKLSKTILKDDPENYMALIFMGLSLQEVGPKDQVPGAFRKAIDVSSSNPLAWNGLANYYEKLGDTSAQKELIPIYTTLLTIERTDKKVNEICEKIISMPISEENVIQVVDIFKTIVNSTDLLEETISLVWSTKASIISKLPEVPSSLIDTYTQALSFVVHMPKLVTKKDYNEYLKMLYKQKKYFEVFEECDKMHRLYETDATALEWTCKVYNELRVEDNSGIYAPEEIRNACDTLLRIQGDSSMGLFTKAVLLFEDNNFYEASQLLNEVTNIRSGLLHAWVLLSMCYMELHMYHDALQAALRADKLLLSIHNSNLILRKKVDQLMLDSLSQHGDDESLHKAVEIGKQMNCEDTKVIKSLIKCYINLEAYVDAQMLLSKLKENSDEKCTVILLKAQLLHKQQKLKDALELLLQSEPQSVSEWWFEIALLHWDLENFKESLVPLLKAAKLDQNCYTYFLYLGHYYKKFNNLEKARRCYEKAFKMNQKCIEAAVELTKLFRANKNWDANVTLLQSVTADVPDVDTEWAWIQLGLNYLAQGEYSRAIDALRYVLRINPNNSHCWESLGDAYMGRGAYTSAMKSYQKASEITPDLLYPLLQVGNIRRTLGEYVEAKKSFEEILATNKSYVPALKGLAETYIQQARLFKKNYLFGSARDNAQSALDTVIVGIKQRNDLSCLWKLAGDCCYLVATLPERHCCMLVLAALAEGTSVDGNKILEKDELFSLAERLYHKAATLCQNNASVWHDLGTCFLSHANSLHHNKHSETLYIKAATVIEYCIELNPGNWQHWNLKGLIAVYSGEKNYALAQHSFIKAVMTDDHSAVAWCNLGVLYLVLEDFKLANEAFGQAQRADPNFVNCWIGQALIAENLSYTEDAMDLFRHSTQLGIHTTSCIGYGHWVCKTLLNAPQNAHIYAIHNMNAVPVACDALTWYTDNNPDDACAWNMLGILRERMGLKDSATQAFRSALLQSNKEFRDKARTNYARLLFKQEKYKQAIDVYKDVQEATFNSGSGLALALFKDGQYEESYETYEQALHWLAEETSLQSDLLVALGAMAYMFQGPDTAKTLLFQSTELKSPSPYGLYATLALGLLHKDMVLPKLVLKELKKQLDNPSILPHYTTLFLYTCLTENDHRSAIREISTLIHIYPSSTFLWLSLSELLIRIRKKNLHLIPTASKASQRAAIVGLTGDDAIKVWCITSAAFFSLKDYKEALKMAQRAVHCYPHVAEVWTVLISAMMKSVSNVNDIALRIIPLVKYVKENLKPSKKLLDWLNNIH